MPDYVSTRGQGRDERDFLLRGPQVRVQPPATEPDRAAEIRRAQPTWTGRRRKHLSSPKEVQFSAFYRAEKVRVMRFLMKIGADAHEADDIAQSAFMEAWTSWGRIHTDARAWVRKVATNKFYRSGPQREVPTSDLPDRPGSLVAEAAVELGEAARTVHGLLAELPPMQRIVLAWKADGFSVDEIARATPCRTEAAVRKNLQRARATLKRLLSEREGGISGE